MRFTRLVIEGFVVNVAIYIPKEVPEFVECLTIDLEMAVRLLPAGALSRLQAETQFYVYDNKNATTGTVISRYHARTCTSSFAAGSVTISAVLYVEHRNLWGVGGLLIHELAHAFHDKLCTSEGMNDRIELVCSLLLSYYHLNLLTYKFNCYYLTEGVRDSHGERTV